MSEMVERIALILANTVWHAFMEGRDGMVGEALPEIPTVFMEDARETARSVIGAMRQPTDQQRNAYYELSGKTEVMFNAHWERAIDAALEQP